MTTKANKYVYNLYQICSRKPLRCERFIVNVDLINHHHRCLSRSLSLTLTRYWQVTVSEIDFS